MSMPVMNTSAPPSPTCRAAENVGVSMYRCRTQVMTPSSTRTTAIAIPRANRKSLIRNGRVWPMPPSVVMAPQIRPRTQGCPRPVRLPSSDNASAKPMLMPAPSDAAIPTRNASQLFLVAKAAANTGSGIQFDDGKSHFWSGLASQDRYEGLFGDLHFFNNRDGTFSEIDYF